MIDTGEIRKQYERYDACMVGEKVGFLGCALADQVPALCVELEDEREKVRVLVEALEETLDAYLCTVRFHERDSEWPRASDLSGGAEIVRTARMAIATASANKEGKTA